MKVKSRETRVFIVGWNRLVLNMFRAHGFALATAVEEADLVVFTGGEDVHPKWYGQARYERTYCNESRDYLEILTANLAAKKGIPMAGICRGAQLLNIIGGGSMYQHVNHHVLSSKGHQVVDLIDGFTFQATSTHHQMMKPANHAMVLGVAAESSYRLELDKVGKTIEEYATLEKTGKFQDDVEVVMYYDPLALCFQPHPEYSGCPPCTTAFFQYLDDYVLASGSKK